MTGYELLYYVYVLLFGVYASMHMVCGAPNARFWLIAGILCPALLLAQGICLHFFGADGVRMIYPLIAHLPMVLSLRFAMNARWETALVSVLISYSLCQLLRWVGLAAELIFSQPAAAFIHLALSIFLSFIIVRFSLPAIHRLLQGSLRLLLCFGALPALYYAYDYFMLYSGGRFQAVLALNELLPTAMVLFYALFSIVYQQEAERRRQLSLQTQAMEQELAQAAHDMAMLRVSEEKTAIYRHDLRHHLSMIEQLLSVHPNEKTEAYIREVKNELEAISPARYCENETVNLLLGSFGQRAQQQEADLRIKASLPPDLSLPDTELCALLSNGLENALSAVRGLSERRIDLFCSVRQNNLLIEIRNPCAGEILFRDGLPQANDHQPHYGCLSIQRIVQCRNGMCTFEAENGSFILRIAVPLEV